MSLITYATVQTNCPLFGEGAEKQQKVTIGIRKSEDKLKSVLCDTTFNALVSAVDSGTYPPSFEGLYTIAQKYLSWLTYAEYLKYSQVTDTDAGLRIFQESNSGEARSAQVDSHVKHAEEDATYYLGEMLAYLEQNIEDFSDYKSSNCRKCSESVVYSGKISGAGERTVKRPRTFFKPY